MAPQEQVSQQPKAMHSPPQQPQQMPLQHGSIATLQRSPPYRARHTQLPPVHVPWPRSPLAQDTGTDQSETYGYRAAYMCTNDGSKLNFYWLGSLLASP